MSGFERLICVGPVMEVAPVASTEIPLYIVDGEIGGPLLPAAEIKIFVGLLAA